MPQLDTNIPLGIQPVSFDPMRTLQGLLQFSALEDQQAARQQDFRIKQRTLDDDTALRSAMQDNQYSSGGVNWDAVVNSLQSSGHGTAAFKIKDTISAQRKASEDADKLALDNTHSRLELASSIMAGVREEGTEEAFQKGKAFVVKLFGDKGDLIGQQLGDHYDPTHLDATLAWGRSATDEITAQKNAFDQLAKIREMDAADKRDAPAVADAWKKLGASILPVAKTADQWQKAQDKLKGAGIPDDILSLFPAQFTPDAPAQAAAIGMTPKERADLANTATSQKETAAYHAGELNLGQQRLDVEKAGLGDKKDQAGQIATAIIDGSQPPETTRLYGLTGLVRSELAKKGYNLTQATEDWNATQTWIKTANGGQQTRLRQSLATATDMLPKIKQLADDWDSGGYGPLSRATLTAATNGGLGQAAQSKATKLLGQIADLNSDLGNVYMGGNSPTDKALDLASKSLQADWSKQTLLDNLDQVAENLQYRRNSIKQTGPTGTSATSAYTPGAAGGGTGAVPAGSVKMRSPDGKTGYVPNDKVSDALAKGGRIVP